MALPLYSTNDPYLATYVLSEGATLVSCRRIGPKKVEFRFIADRHLHGLLRLYWRAVPTIVIPIRLFGFHRKLKSRSFTRS